MKNALYLSLCMMVCVGCATLPPQPLRVELAANPDFTQTQSHIEAYVGQQVRWGGTIQSIRNLANNTELQIIARPLNDEARPDIFKASPGRFIADVNGFLDPSDYQTGRQVTIIGTIKGSTTGTIGTFQYHFPVITTSTYYLWPKQLPYIQPVPRPYVSNPYWYDPWYGWYPWYPWWYY